MAGELEPRGAHLENLIANDLLAWSQTLPRRPGIYFWRTSKGADVDFVIETPDRLIPVEVKSSSRVRPGDLRGLSAFQSEYGERVPAAIVLYMGDETLWVREGVLAVPWDRVV